MKPQTWARPWVSGDDHLRNARITFGSAAPAAISWGGWSGRCCSGFSHEKMVIFHSYVSHYQRVNPITSHSTPIFLWLSRGYVQLFFSLCSWHLFSIVSNIKTIWGFQHRSGSTHGLDPCWHVETYDQILCFYWHIIIFHGQITIVHEEQSPFIVGKSQFIIGKSTKP